MDKQHIIALLKDTATLLALHDANPFQVRHYTNAVLQLEKLGDLTLEAILEQESVSSSTLKFIKEISNTGTLQRWEELNAATPQGIREIMSLRGIGPKKVNALWRQLDIDSLAALQRACEEGTIAQLPGFGLKTQATIQASIAFKIQQAGKFHYATALPYATALEQALRAAFPSHPIAVTGALRRSLEVIEQVAILIGTNEPEKFIQWLNEQPLLQQTSKSTKAPSWQWTENTLPLCIYFCPPNLFYKELVLHTGSDNHLALQVNGRQSLETAIAHMGLPKSEADVYKQVGLPYIPPELREGQIELTWAQKRGAEKLLTLEDLRGVFHNHTTYSDGKDSLETMARYCQELGYEYIGITDHSQLASYAGGLTPAEIKKQHQEIDHLNEKLAPFKIFKGIEADILSNGDLDYSPEILASFDFVIASVHAGMDMDLKTATKRVIKAIQNPYTTILAHLTNRLLLKRAGFPIDHQAVIDACADHGVIIEINSSPWRLELDWRWIDYALSKNVMISINPDAHDKESIQNMYYGVCVAKKGGLTPASTFNAQSQEEVRKYLQQRKACLS